jgi:GT2 family glycosyltransferase
VTGDVIAFTDADCRPRPDWLRRAVAHLCSPEAPEAVGGDIHLVFRDGDEPTTGPELYESVHGFDQRHFVEVFHFAATANLVTTSKVLDLVGPFDSDLQSGGDDDWGHRLRAAGGRLVFAEDAVVDHPSRPTWSELTTKSVRVAKGMAALTRGQSLRADLREVLGEVRAGTTVWLSIWSKGWPSTPGRKARYAAAMSWVALIRCGVRTGQRVARRGGAAT